MPPDEEPLQEASSEIATHLDQPAPWENAVKDLQLNFTQQMQQMQQSLVDALSRFNPIANQSQAAPTIDDVSDEELENVVATGQGGKKIRQMVKSEMARLKREHIDPLEQVGLNSIANLTQEIAKQNMPLYDRFKKEIEGKLATVDAASRLNPQVHRLVYNAVVGEHYGELAQEAAEQALRKTKQPAQDSGSPAGRTAGAGAKDESFEAVFDTEAQKAMRDVGRTPDATFIRMGYPGGYKEYIEKNKDYLGR